MGKYKYIGPDFDVYKLRELDESALPEVVSELRDYIISSVKQTGGHLAPSLGVVELTVVLHYLLNTPEDKLIWDVGHQAYAHKILTGRFSSFPTLRQLDGISGFLKRDESEFDVYEAGHASTSVAAAAGFAISRDLNKDDYRIVAVIGDGALTGGLAFEGLNLIGSMKKDVTVILNDNNMSIDKNVGGFSKYFNKMITHKLYIKMKDEVRKLLKTIALKDGFIDFAERVEESIKNIVIKGAFFEDLGFTYIGPVDGHNVHDLVDIISKSFHIKGPKVIHILTQKGKGYEDAEKDPERYHGISPKSVKSKRRKYTDVFSKEVDAIIENDEKVVAVTAAMPSGTGLSLIKEKYPQNYVDMGIAEEGAVVSATAMALNGYKPFVAIYSTFLQRAFDQIIHDTALQKANVRFFLDRAGLVGEDGPTHHGVFDISYLRLIPDMVAMAPKDEKEFKKMIRFAYKYENGPIAVRYPRGEVVEPFDVKWDRIKMGKGELLKEGKELIFLALGRMVREAYDAADMMKKYGYDIAVYNMRFIKPINEKYLLDIVSDYSKVVTFEFGNLPGGIGDAINSIFAKHNIEKDVLNIGIEDHFSVQGTQDELLHIEKLDAKSIYKKVKKWLEKD